MGIVVVVGVCDFGLNTCGGVLVVRALRRVGCFVVCRAWYNTSNEGRFYGDERSFS